MAFDLGTVGTETRSHVLEYDWRTLATYALGVGSKRDELGYLYEGVEGGIRVLPTFAVIPAQAAVFEALERTGGDFAMVVHGAQTIRIHATPTSAGRLETVASLRGIYDVKRFAQVVVDTRTTQAGALVYETTWSIIYRNSGGFGGPRPVSEETPSVPKDREPTFAIEQPTSLEQALLYRLSGDFNPLHADPAFAEKVGFPQGPILHGLCTYGHVGRALVQHACANDPARLRAFGAQFRKPVWPGDTLVTRGFELDGTSATTGARQWALSVSVKERDEAVLGGVWAEVAPSSTTEPAR
jgi:acyl dehydratase